VHNSEERVEREERVYQRASYKSTTPKREWRGKRECDNERVMRAQLRRESGEERESAIMKSYKSTTLQREWRGIVHLTSEL
jgi:hypothetical protein